MTYRSRGGSLEYQDARRVISQHLWRYHDRASCPGTLEDKLEAHGEIHALSKRLTGNECSHVHEPVGDSESAVDQAHRVMREGEEQCDG